MKAIALASGGLDSTLAARLVKDLSIEIVILNFKTPFCLCDKKSSGGGCHNEAALVAGNLGVDIKVVFVSDEFFRVIENPKHGYGSNMNPCIDCRILLFRKAKELMQELGACFIITGEVLGQRPMSQHRRALEIIEKESGLEGLILRPLSAKLLPETTPEKKGWVCRDKLLEICGRSRKPQIELAKFFQIKDYPCSAGGCLLTDVQFSKRIKDLLNCQTLSLNEVELLKVGRHFRIGKQAKLVVGRNETENNRLLNLVQRDDYLFMPKDIAGPAAVGRGLFNEELIRLAAAITCRYCDLDGKKDADISYQKISKTGTVTSAPPTAGQGAYPCLVNISPLEEDKLISLRI